MPKSPFSTDKTSFSAGLYAGSERRQYPRLPATYPICVRFASSSGEPVERFTQTINVAAKGIFFPCVQALEVGSEVGVLMGIPSTETTSLPAAQLEGRAVVVRCEPCGKKKNAAAQLGIAIKFLEKPVLSTRVTMFD
jgi:hypothetical protein